MDCTSPARHEYQGQAVISATNNVAHVTDKMLHACGGTGCKPGLGIERHLRDRKAAPLGFQSLDCWNHPIGKRVLDNEPKKMDPAAKNALAERLMKESTVKAAE